MNRILVITHSTSNTGAPKICLSVIRFFRKHYPTSIIDVISLENTGGTLENEFINLADNYILINTLNKRKDYSVLNRLKLKIFRQSILSEYEHLINKIKVSQYDCIFANTIVSLPDAIKFKNLFTTTKLYLNLLEMSTVIDQLCTNFKDMVRQVDSTLFISEFHKKHIEQEYLLKFEKCASIIPPIELVKSKYTPKDNDGFYHVVMAGSVHWRKGDDVFIQVARKLLLNRKDVKFYWLGPIDDYHKKIVEADLKRLGIQNQVFFSGELENPHAFMKRMDVFLLTSREEPFGLAPAEAGLLGMPIVYFKDVTGIGALLEENNIQNSVSYLDIDEMVVKLNFLIDNEKERRAIGKNTKELMSKFDEKNYWYQLNSFFKLKQYE